MGLLGILVFMLQFHLYMLFMALKHRNCTIKAERARKWQVLSQSSSCLLAILSVTFEPGHEKMRLMSHANNKGADQPAHPRSLISAFIVRYLDSIISLDSIAEISLL